MGSRLPQRRVVPVNLLSKGFFHDRVKWVMLHFNGGRAWVDGNGVGDQVSFSVPTYRDHVGEL